MRPKHAPQRTCAICGTKTDKRSLIRIVRTPEGAVLVDETGKRNGRGTYLCKRLACWSEAAARPRRLSAALRAEVAAPDMEQIAAYAAALAKEPQSA